MNTPSPPAAPDALLLITPGCPHCGGVLEALSTMVKEGSVGRLTVVNVALHPEQAAELGARSAPWTRLGPFELEGAQTLAALREWSSLAGSEEGDRRYLVRLLEENRLAAAEAFLGREAGRDAILPQVIGDPETPLQIRLGVGALIEGWAGTPRLRTLTDALGELSRHPDHRVRSDACHYLGLTADPAAAPFLRERLADPAPDVAEIAAEALEELNGHP